MLKGGFNRNAMQNNQHLTGILTTMSSTRDINSSIILTRERWTLSARECVRTRRSTHPVVATTRRSTTRTRTSWRAVSLTHTFCRCLCFQHLVLNPSTPANADCLHLDDRQNQFVGFYKAEKRLYDRYEEVSGGIKADISPDPLPLPQEMKKKNRRRITRAGLLAIIHCHCKMGNLTLTKMDVQPASPLSCTKTWLILVSLQTSNSFLGKCLTTLQTVPWVKFHF